MGKTEVLIERLEGIKVNIDEKFDHIKDKMELIHTQVMKTNGRVTKLEQWQNKIIGGLLVSNAIIVPVLVWLIKIHLDTK